MTKGVNSLCDFRKTRTHVLLEGISDRLDLLESKVKVLDSFLTENAIRLSNLENQGKR